MNYCDKCHVFVKTKYNYCPSCHKTTNKVQHKCLVCSTPIQNLLKNKNFCRKCDETYYRVRVKYYKIIYTNEEESKINKIILGV